MMNVLFIGMTVLNIEMITNKNGQLMNKKVNSFYILMQITDFNRNFFYITLQKHGSSTSNQETTIFTATCSR